ncbi:DUF4864 domain-containing protein [Sulfitobacter sabulilitoris]|uniref:DUF4864 domain-containing protein n=1 Tax=Sulfitobacter sabulilitoris TaxID=2562655 RepID=A0A5S3Q3R4_9RHOB|nr:DUF4864 domain-containing protein [Sulfitobacter sabulilitoris]TMM51161.1 DUF4864 domain-containing protein [Sulfitobacter sabulilitoris]
MRTGFWAVVMSVMMAFGAQAQEAGIKGTISSQIEAFEADDFETAFGFASPNLQKMFRTPDNFRRMVTEGYPMVWRPGSVRYLELRDIAGDWWQKVMITDQAGKVHILDYRMIETDAGWRIGGVQLLDTAGANV